MKVWLVDSGEYDQYGVDLVAISRDAAIKGIKERYDHHYKVEWFDDGDCLRGEFKFVRNYSTEHTARYYLHEIALVGSEHNTDTRDET